MASAKPEGPLPRILLLSLGGTIAMTAHDGEGVAPRLEGRDLVAAIPGLADVADVEADSFRTVPGAHLSFDDLAALARHIDEEVAASFDGVVVTQGTDTLEETAFLLDLLVRGDRPVVVTGAMRNPTLAGADGPANVLAAVRVASSPAARGIGTLVVLGDEIHAARFVHKGHAQSPAAFVSLPGPLGWVAEGEPRILLTPPVRPAPLAAPDGDQRVALVTVVLDDDGGLLRAATAAGYDGIVVEAFGGGHVPATLMDDLAAAAQAAPLVYASRTGGGEVLRGTYGFPGSELDLQRIGAIGAGWLDGPKARVLLTVLLRSGCSPAQIAEAFARLRTPGSVPPPSQKES